MKNSNSISFKSLKTTENNFQYQLITTVQVKQNIYDFEQVLNIFILTYNF